MRYTVLGKSGLEVSRIAFGTWQLGGDWGPTDERHAIEAIRLAADEGVTLFDTAQSYGFGQSEELLARALRGRSREGLVLATKGGLRRTETGLVRDASAQWIRSGVESSLRALGTDYLDLYQVHWPDPVTPVEETGEELAKLVADGKIRHVGVSNFDVGQMQALDATLTVETLQPPYHLFRRDIEGDVLTYTEAENIGVLVYGPLAHGLLGGNLREDTHFHPSDWRGRSPMFMGETYRRNLKAARDLHRLATEELGVTLAQLAIAWTLANPAVHVAIVGSRSANHVEESLSAVEVELDESVMGRIDAIMSGASPVSGPSPETT